VVNVASTVALSLGFFSTCSDTTFYQLKESIKERDVFIATNPQIRKAYEDLLKENPEDNLEASLMKQLIAYAKVQKLHYELPSQLTPFTKESKPSSFVGHVGFTLITESDMDEAEEWRKYGKSEDIKRLVQKDMKNIQSEYPIVFKKGNPITDIENLLMWNVRWSKRITIIDPYGLKEGDNRKGMLRFLDFIEREARGLKQLRFVLGQHYTGTDDNGDRVQLRGEEARIKYQQLLHEIMNEHPLFSRLERTQISFQAGNSKRFVSFGNDSKEIALGFDKGASVHFFTAKGKNLIVNPLELNKSYSQTDSAELVEYEYKTLSL